ncbi:modifier of mdg4-like isoform X8 [Armigeres subalbatus]|uniref:modifier of mdg4-like isoform X8 n=1 Tax=Armigeres subalbatus TaxID=124917 RepID=UPI002ED45A61
MADDEQFSLCWNNFNTNLSAGFHESLVRGDLVDVTLAAEGQLVKAHRLILSVCSPYFRKMFTQMPANQHAFIFLKDVSHSALKDLIQFMYCGEVNVKQDALPAFISTAEALQIKGLTETGESAPTQPSPAKETTSHLPPSASSTTIPSLASSPRTKPIVRSRNQSYKFDSDDGSDHEKVVQIQATSTPASVVSASSSTVTTQISVPQQVQILQQPTQQAQKRPLQQRASITPQTTQVLKRAKLTDPLEASEPAQIQTVQIVKQITQTPQPSVSSEPEYVEMPIETINPKAEPEYADDPSEVEAIDTEHEQEHSLAEQDTTEHDQAEDDSAHYVEDETYGDMSKYDETYFAEGEDAKAGASGFSESYAESGTGADQAAQVSETEMLRCKYEAIQSNSEVPPDQRKILKRSATEAAPSIVPLHNGSNTYISTKDLVNIYTPKAALYTARLIDVIFGRDNLIHACLNRTEHSGDLVPLDKDKLASVIVHVVNVFRKQNVEISEPLVQGYIRNRLCYLQSSRKFKK